MHSHDSRQGRHEGWAVHLNKAKVMSVLTIKARMYINLGVLATAMVLVCAVALSAFNDSSRRMHQLHAENLVPITQINEIYQRSLQSQRTAWRLTFTATRRSRRRTTPRSKRIGPASTSSPSSSANIRSPMKNAVCSLT